MIIDNLITNRSLVDVTRLKELKAKGWANMTEAEREEYLASIGAYNATDMNRVGEATTYLSELLTTLPDVLRQYAEDIGVGWDVLYNVPYDYSLYRTEGKVDWAIGDIPTQAQMEEYLDKVRLLRDSLITAPLPADMDGLDYKEANAIEEALVKLDKAIAEVETVRKTYMDNAVKTYIYSGEAFAGEF